MKNKHGWPVPEVKWWGEVGREIRIPYRCGSWRCPECRDFSRRRDFVRIEQALKRHRSADVVFIVLTLDPSRFLDVWDAFEGIVPRWRSLAKWLKRLHGLSGFVGTVEVHKSGWPHVNVLAVSPGLAKLVRAKRPDGDEARKRWAPDEMKGAAVRCGWGPRMNTQIPDSVGAVTSYMVKVAGETEARVEAMSTTGEVTKSTQLPLNAPPHFRRLRSSPGFLPPVVRSGEWTGKLEFAPLPAAELEKWKLDQAEKAKAKATSGAKRAKRRTSRYIARRRWFQLTFDLRAAEPAQLALPLAA